MDDACRLDLPQRRLAGIVPTGLASRINAALKNRIIALGAFRPGGCQPGFVGGFEAQRVDEAVAIVVAEFQDLPVADVAVGLGQPRIAFGMQALGALIVYDFVGLDRRSIVINLHISDRGNQLVIIIISDLVGLHQHLGIRGGLGCDARSGGFRPQLALEGQVLRKRRPAICQAKANERYHRCGGGSLKSSDLAAMTARHDVTLCVDHPPRHRQPPFNTAEFPKFRSRRGRRSHTGERTTFREGLVVPASHAAKGTIARMPWLPPHQTERRIAPT